MATCKGCGRRIVFFPTDARKLMPCDPDPVPFEPDESGSMMLFNNGKLVRARLSADSDLVGYVPHWATCSKADHFKGGK